jgi:excisionase family DNA binding protein
MLMHMEEEICMELLTIQETARMLKVNPITIRRYIASGRLPAVRVGRGVRVRKEAVDQLIEEVVPKKARRAAPVPRGKPFTMDDPLWKVVGIGRSGGKTNVAANKDEYIAAALMAEFHPREEA